MSPNLSAYNYYNNNPIRYKDIDGKHPIIIALVASIWAAVEVGMSAYDAYDTGKTLVDPHSIQEEKWIAAVLFTFGVVYPGGGYSQLDNLRKWGIKT